MDLPREPASDEAPRSAAADPPLALHARTPGPPGLARKVWLAALGLLILVAMVAAAWVGLHASRKGALQRPPSEVTQRP